jgi:hypothetical protein
MSGLALDVPDHTTLSRRLRKLEIPLGTKRRGDPLHLVIDSTGLAIFGEGEWARAKHGSRGKRGWRKLHLGVSDSGEILAQVVTDASVDDAMVGCRIVEHVPGKLASVTADAAYDTHEVYAAARARNAAVVVPPIASATPDEREQPRSPERDATVRRVRTVGLREWKRRSGYGRQGAAENAFFRYKTIVGPALRARDEDGRQIEARLGCVLLNRMRKVAWPESVAIPASSDEVFAGMVHSRNGSCTNALLEYRRAELGTRPAGQITTGVTANPPRRLRQIPHRSSV